VQGGAEIDGLAIEQDALERLVTISPPGDRTEAEIGLERVDRLAAVAAEFEGRRGEVGCFGRPELRLGDVQRELESRGPLLRRDRLSRLESRALIGVTRLG